MKGITMCADCAYYNMKTHKCTYGAKDPGKATDSFYADCPLDDAELVRHGRWISVEDALPDALQNVLVCTDINTVTVAWINGEGWTFADTGNGHTENWGFDDVKYWMHLPEPPKGEQK